MFVAEAAGGAFDVFDTGVRGFGLGVGDAGDEQDFDGGPPAAQGVPQPVGLGHVGDVDVVAQAHLLLVGVGEAGAGQQASKLFLDAPGGGEFPGGVVSGEGCFQACLTGPRLWCQGL